MKRHITNKKAFYHSSFVATLGIMIAISALSSARLIPANLAGEQSTITVKKSGDFSLPLASTITHNGTLDYANAVATSISANSTGLGVKVELTIDMTQFDGCSIQALSVYVYCQPSNWMGLDLEMGALVIPQVVKASYVSTHVGLMPYLDHLRANSTLGLVMDVKKGSFLNNSNITSLMVSNLHLDYEITRYDEIDLNAGIGYVDFNDDYDQYRLDFLGSEVRVTKLPEHEVYIASDYLILDQKGLYEIKFN